jgi:hypothetical protein
MNNAIFSKLAYAKPEKGYGVYIFVVFLCLCLWVPPVQLLNYLNDFYQILYGSSSTKGHHTTSHTTPHHTTPHHTTPHHTTPHHTTPHHTTPCRATPRHTTPHHTTPYHSTSKFSTLRYNSLADARFEILTAAWRKTEVF